VDGEYLVEFLSELKRKKLVEKIELSVYTSCDIELLVLIVLKLVQPPLISV